MFNFNNEKICLIDLALKMQEQTLRKMIKKCKISKDKKTVKILNSDLELNKEIQTEFINYINNMKSAKNNCTENNNEE